MKHLPKTGKKFILGVGEIGHAYVLIYPGKPLVCLGLNGNYKVAMFFVFIYH